MTQKLKVLHLLGVVLFFGSILAHTVASITASMSNDPQTLFIVRQVMQAQTSYLLIPGIFLFLLSGITMLALKDYHFAQSRWLILHASVGVLIVLNSFFILLPAGQELLELSRQAATGALQIENFQSIRKTESIFGGINLILCLIMVISAVIKPRLGAK